MNALNREMSPFQALLKTNVAETAAFLRGTSIVRHILRAEDTEDGIVLAPLRGALPILWSAEGDQLLEDGFRSRVVELPLGVFNYVRRDGVLKSTSPQSHQKAEVINKYVFTLLSENPDSKFRLVDEVQKGSTLSQAVRLSRAALDRYDSSSLLRVIAAQDSRRKVMSQPKTNAYMNLSANNLRNVETMVVPMPLVPTDRNALLDTVYLEGDFSSPANFADRITVDHNYRSQAMFRTLGSTVRSLDFMYDNAHMNNFVNEQGYLTESESARAEDWITKMRTWIN